MIDTPMNRDELLNLAALDVHGLLDAYETDLFNRSFHDASAAVQDEVIAMQAMIAADSTLLADEAPSPDLRAKVLARVAEAIEHEADALAPIPIFQRRRAEAERHNRALRRLERSNNVWRLLTFTLAACFVIAIVLFVRESARMQIISEMALLPHVGDELEAEIGPGYRAFAANPNCKSFWLAPANDNRKGIATVYMNDEADSVFVLAMGLDAGKYRAVARDDEGDVLFESRSFTSTGAVAAVREDDVTDFAALEGATWEIISEDGSTIMLRGAYA